MKKNVRCYILLGRTLIMVLHEVQTRIQAHWFEKHALIQDLGVIVSGLSFST
jgi:hypothetical protein